MVVDESPWVLRCPRCGRTDRATQAPVTRGSPCVHCGQIPFPRGDAGLEFIMFYQCLACGQRYLTPKIDPTDILLEALHP